MGAGWRPRVTTTIAMTSASAARRAKANIPVRGQGCLSFCLERALQDHGFGGQNVSLTSYMHPSSFPESRMDCLLRLTNGNLLRVASAFRSTP